MKKIFVILSVIMSMFMFASCGDNSQKHDFSKVDLGMSTDELIATVGEPDQKFSDMYTYVDKEVYGIPHTTLTYEIDDSGVCTIHATFNNQYNDDKSYIKDYNTMKKNLIKEWGEPTGISEDEAEFNFMCYWKYSGLTLSKDDDGSVRLSCLRFSSQD